MSNFEIREAGLDDAKEIGKLIYTLAKKEGAQHIVLRLGSLDSELDSIERNHIWVSQKASWYTLNSNLPKCQEFE
jgi:hypothetical protein